MATRRTALSGQQLHQTLARAFERIRPLRCRSCTMPAPVRVARPDYDAANWEIPLTIPCEHECVSFMRWLSAQYGRLYDLSDE